MDKLNHGQIAKLVEKSKHQDSVAFAELYKMLYQKVYFFALSLTKNETMAEDAVQESFMGALSSLSSLKNDRLFVAWLNKITYNVCMSSLSKKQSQPLGEVYEQMISSIPDEGEDSNPLAYAVTNERSRALMKEIQKLSPPLRTTIIMYYYNNMKLQEISVVLDCPIGTVKSRLDSARKQLKKFISGNTRGEKNMLNLFGGMSISTALADAGKNISMDPNVALNGLMNTLAENGMSTAVDFTPSTNAAPNSTPGKAGTIATIGGIAAIAAVGVVSLQYGDPEIAHVEFDNSLTKDPVNVEIKVNGNDNVSEVVVAGNGSSLKASKVGDGLYSVVIPQNGTYSLIARNEKGKKDSRDLNIGCIDRDGPILVEGNDKDEQVYLILEDDMAGVDFQSAYAILSDGTKKLPVEADKNTGKITFEIGEDEGVFSVYVSDKLGNESKFNAVRTKTTVVEEKAVER